MVALGPRAHNPLEAAVSTSQDSPEVLPGEGSGSKLIRLLAGLNFSWTVDERASGPCFLADCRPEATLSSLPCGLLQRDNLLHLIMTAKKPLWREYQQTDIRVLCDLISEVMPHCFCHVLFTRNMLLCPAHIQGDRIIQGVNTGSRGQ